MFVGNIIRSLSGLFKRTESPVKRKITVIIETCSAGHSLYIEATKEDIDFISGSIDLDKMKDNFGWAWDSLINLPKG